MSANNHAMDEDEVDDFLYGSDTSETNYGTTSKTTSNKNKLAYVDTEEDEEIYQQYNEDMANRASTKEETTMKDADVAEKDEVMEEDQQDDEDSDDDLDIILEDDEDDDHSVDEQQPSSQKSQDVSNESTKSVDALVNIKLGQQGKDASESNDTANKASTASGKKSSGGVDVEKIGDYNGQPITDVDLDMFEDKPWRKPGADITDYFNFGFNELSWKAYCAKQKNMRDKKATGKDGMPMPDFMTGMGDMPDFMKMGMMMPMMDGDMPMPMMEGGMPMGMPMGMMNPMMGMPPPPPPPPHRHQQMNGPPMGGPNRSGAPMGSPSMGGSGMGNTSNRPTGTHNDRGGQGNQNYGGSSGNAHSYSRGQRR